MTMTIFRICQVECRRIVFISFFVCLWPGYIGDSVERCSVFSSLAIRVGGRVACPVVVFAIISGTWFSVLVIDLHQ